MITLAPQIHLSNHTTQTFENGNLFWRCCYVLLFLLLLTCRLKPHFLTLNTEHRCSCCHFSSSEYPRLLDDSNQATSINLLFEFPKANHLAAISTTAATTTTTWKPLKKWKNERERKVERNFGDFKSRSYKQIQIQAQALFLPSLTPFIDYVPKLVCSRDRLVAL